MKINITGDFAPIRRVSKLIDNEEFSSIYNDTLKVLKDADLSITNLELPLTNHSTCLNKTGPALKALPKSVEALKFAGFNLVTLANNHILDYREDGLRETISILDANKIGYVGAGSSNHEARKPYIFVKEGKRIAVISIAENEWSTTFGDTWGANPLMEIDNFNDIVSIKKEVDFVLVIVHAGHEHNQLPAPRIKKLFRFFVDAGADAVVGHHTHAYSGYEFYKKKPIVYSVGNFIFDWNKGIPYWNEGQIAQIEFVDKECVKLNLVPIIQNDEHVGVRLMNKDEKNVFINQVNALNEVICDDNRLEKAFSEFLREREKLYTSYLQPYSNINLHRLRKIGLLPKDIIGNKKKRLLINLIRCEAHREALLHTLISSLK